MASFEILPGLPAYGAPAVPFPFDPRGSFREGLVVRFFDEANNSSWIGNFRQSFRGEDLVTLHPNGRLMIVVAGGEGYVVDPSSREQIETFGFAIESIVLADDELVILADHTRVYIFTASGTWVSEALFWDGFRGLKVIDEIFHGEGWSVFSDTWHPFSLNLLTRETTGPIYPVDLTQRREPDLKR